MSHPHSSGTAPTLLATLSSELAGAVERAGRSVVAVHARPRIPASGIVWRPGVVVATHHTIQRDEDITVVVDSGTQVQATLVGRDPATDLAVLRIPEDAAPRATLAGDDALRVGALVLAVGRPGRYVTTSLGVVSALDGEWRTWTGGRIDRFVRLDLTVYDGFSGGPLVDASGSVLGVNDSALLRGAPTAIPATTVSHVVDQLLATGHVQRGYLGVAVQGIHIARELASRAGTEATHGVLVLDVVPDGPADRGGLLLGDVVLSANGTALGDPADLFDALAQTGPDASMPLEVLRAGSLMNLVLTVGRRPASPRAARQGKSHA